MYFFGGLEYSLIMLIFTIFLSPILFGTIFAQDGNLTNNSNNSQNNNETNNSAIQINKQKDVQGWVAIFRDIGIPIMTLSAGIVSAKFIVNSWQKRKEISDIRKQVLKDFQESFKDYLIMMEMFIAKILFKYYSIDKPKSAVLKENKLSDLLPFGYQYKLSKNNSTDDLNNLNLIFDFSVIDNYFVRNALQDEFNKFEAEFINKRTLVTKFLSGLRQYYKNGLDLNKEFDELWEGGIMYAHILIHTMMKSECEDEFICALRHFNNCISETFEKVKYYDISLAKERIKLH